MEDSRAHWDHPPRPPEGLLSALEELGELDNTIVMLISDKGTSGEGGYFVPSQEMACAADLTAKRRLAINTVRPSGSREKSIELSFVSAASPTGIWPRR